MAPSIPFELPPWAAKKAVTFLDLKFLPVFGDLAVGIVEPSDHLADVFVIFPVKLQPAKNMVGTVAIKKLIELRKTRRWHSTEVALVILARQPRVRFSTFLLSERKGATD